MSIHIYAYAHAFLTQRYSTGGDWIARPVVIEVTSSSPPMHPNKRMGNGSCLLPRSTSSSGIITIKRNELRFQTE